MIYWFYWQYKLGPMNRAVYTDGQYDIALAQFQAERVQTDRCLILTEEEDLIGAAILEEHGFYTGQDFLKEIWVRQEVQKINKEADEIFGEKL